MASQGVDKELQVQGKALAFGGSADGMTGSLGIHGFRRHDLLHLGAALRSCSSRGGRKAHSPLPTGP